jgi:hypothetical protein
LAARDSVRAGSARSESTEAIGEVRRA